MKRHDVLCLICAVVCVAALVNGSVGLAWTAVAILVVFWAVELAGRR